MFMILKDRVARYAQNRRIDRPRLANPHNPNDIPDFSPAPKKTSPGILMIPKGICACAKDWIASRPAVLAWRHIMSLNLPEESFGLIRLPGGKAEGKCDVQEENASSRFGLGCLCWPILRQ